MSTETNTIPHNPNLLCLQISLPMWTNAEIQEEIQTLENCIQKIESKEWTDKRLYEADYYKQKQDLLKKALNTRNTGKI